ncbi:4-hydroxy-tetrahydrodipicolinate reductase [Clostridium sp.]|uniref:4-hydroxy-tetrahydrodipicolinate reductase n=1 Tax=Clostridium sp. TaxID=1506 RepID=UPI0034647101
MINILLNGCNGKMGQVVTQCSKIYENLNIVCGVDRSGEKLNNYPVYKSIDDVKEKIDVIIDFSRPEALKDLIEYSIANKAPVVLCSTGFTPEQLEYINESSKHTSIFRSANMSIGINVLNAVLKRVSPFLYENFDIEIVEKHHNQKVDSPSGTALLLADTIKDSLKDETNYVYGREGIKKREENEIGIHAIRGGNIVGDHEVIFAGGGEVLEFNHKAISRDVFAHGALKAAEFITGKNPGLYNMDHMINLDHI